MPVWLRVFLVAVLLVVSNGCAHPPAQVEDAADAVAPSPRDPVQIAPDTLAHRGEIVSVDPGAQFDPAVLDGAGAVVRAVYRSTSGVSGDPTEVGGVFAVPEGDPPSGGWPVVSVGHGTTGIEHGCGPSLHPDLSGYLSTVTGLLSNGYAVAMTDYEGLDDVGQHPYLEPRTAAYNVIDAVRAIAHLFPNVSTRWAANGGSQGGQAAWAANDFNAEYGQDLQLVGAVALAPAVNITAMAELAYQKRLTREQRGAFPLMIVGLVRAGLLPSDGPYLRGAARPSGAVLGCGPVSDATRRSLRIDDVGPDSAEAAQALQHALQQTALPQHALSAPMAVLNGTQDMVIPPGWVNFSVDLSCKLGGDIQHVELSQADHSGGFPYGDIQEWLDKRFAGAPTEPNCGQ